jgi:transcriptional regulator with XRE-family HTH domain
MKNKQELGQALYDLRIARALTQEELGRLVQIPRERVAGWEQGRVTPTGGELASLAEILKLPDASSQRLYALAGLAPPSPEGDESLRSSDADSILATELRVQLQDLKASLASVSKSIRTASPTSTTLPSRSIQELEQELRNANTALTKMDASTRAIGISAPLRIAQDLTVDLVPLATFQRIEEYRDQQSRWSTAVAAFLGAVLGITVNATTGGQINSFSAALLIAFVGMGYLCFRTERYYSRRLRNERERILAAQLSHRMPEEHDADDNEGS